VTLRTGGVPKPSRPGTAGREAIVGDTEHQSLLGRAATLEDVGKVAAFVGSDRASTMTAATANISCGALIDAPEATDLYRMVDDARAGWCDKARTCDLVVVGTGRPSIGLPIRSMSCSISVRDDPWLSVVTPGPTDQRRTG
jgi:hypothetical protein